MVYSLLYRRPAPESRMSINSEKPSFSGASESSEGSGIIAGIPSALSFDRIISGGTCPPCTTRDFMNYLVYIEHAAENLQFYLWITDYIKRFSNLPESEKVLSPPISIEKLEMDGQPTQRGPKASSKLSKEAMAIFKESGFDSARVVVAEKCQVPFDEPAPSVDGDHAGSQTPWNDDDATTLKSSRRTDYQQVAADAYKSADVKLQPFTVQPFRKEIERIITVYIADGASRQLNLASKERTNLVRALASTTHPSAFQSVLRTIEWSLRHQAHPNFIRWTICNGNRPRVIFARGLGISGIVAGIVTGLLITLSSAGRPWRVMAAIPFLIGIPTLFAAWKGMCVVLHGMHHRHLRPWELFANPEDDGVSMYENKNGSMDSFGSSNSYEDEPWVAKYEKRNILRKILDREVWIKEPALRQIQDTIFIQALLTGVLVTAIIVGIFAAVPGGNKF